MDWIDGHIDLAYLALKGRNIETACKIKSGGCISIPDLQQSPIKTFFGTVYTSPSDIDIGYRNSAHREEAFRAGVQQLDVYKKLEQSGALRIQKKGCTINKDLSMLLLMEGADPIRNPEDVSWWRDQGLRIVGLTWSVGTRYAGGNSTSWPSYR